MQIPDTFSDVLLDPDVIVHSFSDDGTFPNNEHLPTLLLRGAFRRSRSDLAAHIERVFRAHGWRGTWRNGIFSYHHYHSTSHEVLGVSRGSARVQLGGPEGSAFEVESGDVMVLPAGVAHKNLDADGRFQVIGAYPNGREWDLKTGERGERPKADRNIEQVPLPEQDPVYGRRGPVMKHWELG